MGFVGLDLTVFYLFFLTATWVIGLFVFLAQLTDRVEPLGAMGRVVVLITTLLSIATLLIHAYRDKVVSPDEIPASVIVGVLFGSLLGLALCFIIRAFRKTPLNG